MFHPKGSNPGSHDLVDGPEGGRIAYSAISMLCLLLIGVNFGVRARNLRFSNLRELNVLRCLVILLYVVSMALVFTLNMLLNAVHLQSITTCKLGIIFCLSFYVGSKILMYLFLVERAHAIRVSRRTRARDWVWVTGVIVILTGFGSIVVVAFLTPIYTSSALEGTCMIGLPTKVIFSLMSYDIAINVLLTGMFVHFLMPTLRYRHEQQIQPPQKSLVKRWMNVGVSKETTSTTSQTSRTSLIRTPVNSQPFMAEQIEKLIKKSLIGAILVLIPTIVNLVLIYEMGGAEQGWLCFTLCTLDVTWSVCVVHWLTTDPLETDQNPRSERAHPLSHYSVTSRTRHPT